MVKIMEEQFGQYENFIGSYHNVVDSDFCQSTIKAFDYYHDIGTAWCEDDQFSTGMAGRFGWACDLGDMAPMMKGNPSAELNTILFNCLDDYTKTFGTLTRNSFYSTHQKVQKTPAGGGYHVWHDENTGITYTQRSMVWMLYLNDDYEGGETEFLYYKKRVQPERGKLIIWPAHFTHVHRGGLVLEGMKYVITGWFSTLELDRDPDRMMIKEGHGNVT